ncbi:DUF485 domain-containing protein [Pseudothauera nasutitermitis]|uniref:DUF485 domain-containing protein n=1 Tax=Pseudothauera nasutitermitis TaxID=2565930 RepID=A0A4S4AVJ9_9RHOO|nr:DUF485 domain-containing protein [Pseudothauera nasutitermitis]THF63978.1 DUF485 domain-containing protein [Pseudothauera nasutitermitis]
MYAHIKKNPRFAELVNKRARLVWSMMGILSVFFYGFVLLVAFAPEFIATRLFEGSNLTWGIVLGFLQFVVFLALTLVYVRRANGELDALNAEIVTAAWREGQ